MSFFTAKLPEKAKKIEILPKFQRWMEKTNILEASFIILNTWNGNTENQAIDDFIYQQKSANTKKETATDMNTLLRYMEANGMKNERIESLPASKLDHLLSKSFLNARKKNREEYEPATVSSFQLSDT